MVKKETIVANVDAIRHKDKRSNIPTEELRDFVAEEELTPKTILYPRDPSLDPQLVWKGKDIQDQQDLPVAVVPIYIQEKIHPQAIIGEMLSKVEEMKEGSTHQLDLFADFNGGPEEFDQKVEFYRHNQNWTNRLVLGDSLLVMNSLAEKEGLKGKVQCIYFDPPYGIKFGSNWQISTRKRDVKDGRAEDATRQPEQVKTFRDTWKLGIHSYLPYLRDRLQVAHELLTETGSLFMQIGDDNVHLVRCLLDEVFGSQNFISQIVFRKKTMPLGAKYLESISDHLLWYAKNSEVMKYRRLFVQKSVEGDTHWNKVELPDGSRHSMSSEEINLHKLLPAGAQVYQLISLYPAGLNNTGLFPVTLGGRTYVPPSGRSWSTNPDGMKKLLLANRIEPYSSGETIRYILKLNDYNVSPLTSTWADSSAPTDMTYVVQTNVEVVRRCLLMTTDPGDLVLDPTCGSGTTAFVAEQWGRRWITCDTSRVALALARTRLMSARFPYYILADTAEGITKEAEIAGVAASAYRPEGDIRKGFVYRRVPHVTLKSIANNPDIKEGMSRAEIDDAIARHADSETLYDKPFEDGKRVRVSGPFSVESLSPHRVLSTADENMDGTVTELEARKHQDFVTMILDNLKRTGVQNTHKKERLKFDRLESYAGVWIHASAEYVDSKNKACRVAVSIGPEHGTVGPEQIKEAAKEAVQGVGFDVLIVCGFAFDPHVTEEVKRYGKLIVLPTKMNPDLVMGDELLQKTGTGNLFMVFGEPDIDIRKLKNGLVVVEIKGVDVYDPTTGEIRSSSTDRIACWFIDTDYNGESFFVRHAYFTGADEPYERLKRALRAEIDESAWQSLYRTVSLEFKKPVSGRIAIKVINHYGDEVLKVFDV